MKGISQNCLSPNVFVQFGLRSIPPVFRQPQEASMSDRFYSRPQFLIAFVAIGLLTGLLAVPVTRNIVAKALGSLRMQKVQAVNVDLSSFTDPNANPALHQMVAQMISDKVAVTVNEDDQPAADAPAAAKLAGFPVQLLSARKDPPKLVVSGAHAINLTVDRTRLQAIFNEAGHPELVVAPSLDGAAVAVQIPRAVQAQYGNCPAPTTATNAIADNITGPGGGSTEYSDCVRLRQGPSPVVNVPPDLDIQHLAEIGLEVAGMSPDRKST